jgi:hypothetical protein
MPLLQEPTSLWRRLVAASVSYGLGKALFGALAGVAAAVGLKSAGLTVSALFAGVATIFGVIEAGIKVHRETKKNSMHELEGCLETLLAIINPPGATDYDKGARATLHLPVDKGTSFVQVVNYVGSQRAGKTAGRRFPSNAGLAGRVLRTGAAYAASRQVANHEAYVRELIDEWGYTEDAARSRDMSAMSWMAVPMEHRDNVEGLLYLDSTVAGFFDDPVRRAVIVSAAIGIAQFTVRRYTGEGGG